MIEEYSSNFSMSVEMHHKNTFYCEVNLEIVMQSNPCANVKLKN